MLKDVPLKQSGEGPDELPRPPSPPGAVFTKVGLAALPVRHSWAKEA